MAHTFGNADCPFCENEHAAFHIESSGFVVQCDLCHGCVRLAGQILRNPDADKIDAKVELKRDLGMLSKAEYAKARSGAGK